MIIDILLLLIIISHVSYRDFFASIIARVLNLSAGIMKLDTDIIWLLAESDLLRFNPWIVYVGERQPVVL